MNPTLWSRAAPLFAEALEQPPEARDAWLAEHCDDPELAEVVRTLLAADDAEVTLLDGVALDAVPDEEASRLFASAPETVGPWRIREQVGTGGMGLVYRAERNDGAFEQTVALKLIKRGMDSDAVLRRFQAERRILARLEHPGIARLIDGGLAEDGRPYLAMEFVEGEPITETCDRLQLGVEARLDLFRQACEAVDYAHRQLVVHRDLKPSNVLVTESKTGERRVKLLDFGIARVLADDATETPLTVLTAPGQFVLTPEYAAPEQVAGGTISTATDVYALGILLYELLVGQRPYEFDARTPGVIEHVVQNVQPARPSTAVTDSPTTHGMPTDRLRRQLAGDLDMICLTALRKEPERRYASVAALSDDIRRHQENLPVQARPDTVGYRARTFMRRHRVGLGATAAALLAIALVSATAFARVSDERDRAQTEAEKAEQVSTFIADLFRDGDPNQTQGDSALVVDVLNRGAERIRTELDGQPEVQGTLLRVIGEVYSTVGRYDEADSLLTTAVTLHRNLSPPDPDELANSLNSLGALRRQLGDYEATHSLFQEALQIWEQIDPTSEKVATAYFNLGGLRYDTGAYPASDSLTRLGLAIQERLSEDGALELAPFYEHLGRLALDAGDFPRADSLTQRTLAIHREHLEPPHGDIANSLLTASIAKRRLEQYDEAETYLLESLGMMRALYGDVHSEVGYVLNHLASLEGNRGNLDDAERYARESLEVRRAVFGNDHIEVAASLGNLAGFQRDREDYDGGRETLREAQRIVQSSLGPEHPFNGSMRYRIAMLDAADGRTAAAERGFQEALGIYRTVWPDGHAQIAELTFSYAQLIGPDRPDEARAFLDESEASCRITPETADGCLERAETLRAGLPPAR
ncbi:MAG: hypothetical protein Rubg2KO_31810 [Rubricoccaceae bacterium]